MRLRERLYRFMQGRNGVDALARFLNKLSFGCLISAILFTFISIVCLRHNAPIGALVFRILYYITYGIGLFLMVFWIFRVFSRRVAKRQAENTRFLYRSQRCERRIASLKQRWKDRKTLKYFRCPQCKQMMRAPRHKGKIRVTCSKCGHVFIEKT